MSADSAVISTLSLRHPKPEIHPQHRAVDAPLCEHCPYPSRGPIRSSGVMKLALAIALTALVTNAGWFLRDIPTREQARDDASLVYAAQIKELSTQLATFKADHMRLIQQVEKVERTSYHNCVAVGGTRKDCAGELQ